MKMRVVRITFGVLVIVLLRVGCCEEIGDDLAERKEGKAGFLPGSVRRTTTQSSVNGTRDSQLLSLLAARRRQLLNDRLATHVNTLASLAHKANKSNTTFAQLEIRDSNNSTVKRLTFENTSSESTPVFKLVTTDGSKEIRQEIKPHEIRHLFIPKTYQENRSRAAFLNNRRKPIRPVTLPDRNTEPSIVYVPPDKLEEYEKEIELDPDEEFQVDESNHGLYLLNYSNTENVTQSPAANVSSTVSTEVKDVTANISTVATTTENVTTTSQPTTVKAVEEEKPETNTIANSTDTKVKIENEKDKDNQTLFMSDEIYKHFRPLEELPDEEMAPFLHFGDKLGGGVINDNLTNSPSLSASTKSVNFIAAPAEKRKFNSRFSATEKYKNTSVDEEEINEDMDVSVVKNVIEKNKIRNTVKGPAPARHVGLVNAYRKYSSTTSAPTKAPNIGQLNVTDPIVSSVIFESKENNNTNGNITIKDLTTKITFANTTKESTNKTSTTPPPIARNFTRSYYNLRRKPSRLTAATSTENILPTVAVNTTTTEKASTVYTAVVTSVSITSSMKGQNRTEPLIGAVNTNLTSTEVNDLKQNVTTPKVLNETETSTILTPISTVPSSTPRSFRHRIRIRTTTTESSLIATAHPLTSEIPKHVIRNETISKIRNETISKITDRLESFFNPNDYTNSTTSSTIRPKRRRRPTTTTTTTTTSAPTFFTAVYATTQNIIPTQQIETSTATPYVATTKMLIESPSKSSLNTENSTETLVNITLEDPSLTQNEEVVIEAEKTYTASYVLAGLGFLPVAAIVAFVLRSILNKKTKEIDTEYEGYFDEGSDVKKETSITPVARPPLPTPIKPDQKWEFPRNKLRLQTLLGQGNFGQVWKAEADDLNGHDGLTRLVAVKSIKETASQKEKQELLHEIYIMQKIGTHPNVVTLLACCTEQEPYLLIMEYVMCGKLLTYLRERRSRPDRFSGSGALTSRDLTVFAYCVARGMDYIASKGIVHRDLAARNVLVDHNKLCKIADFGMSRVAGAAGGARRGARGALPVRWCAPEALLYNVYTSHTDVWAFGILLWEIVTLGSTPYAAMSGREVLAAVTEGYRLERPPHCKPQLYRAMHACWHADPSQRPSFSSLKAQLAELLDNEPAEGHYVDLDSFYQESSVYSDPSAIINDDEGLSAEYDRERRCFRELATAPSKFENRGFNLRDEELRNKFGIGTPRMGGFGIRDLPFNERTFSDGEFGDRNFNDKNFTDRNFTDKNFNDTNFTERKDGKLSTSSFHRERERERENPLVSRNSFNGFPRIGTRDSHFQLSPDGRNKRVSEFECDI